MLFVLASLSSVAATILLPAVLARAVNEVIRGGGVTVTVLPLALLLAVAALGDILVGVAQGACTATSTAALRHAGLRHTLRLGFLAQRRFPAGDLTSRLVASTADRASILPAAVNVACGVAVSCGGIVALGLIGWPLAVTFLVTAVPAAVTVNALMRISTDLFTVYRQIQGTIASRLADALAGVRTIRAAGTTRQETGRILAPLSELSRTGYATWAAQRRSAWQAMLVAALAEVAVLSVAGIEVAVGKVSPGGFVAAAGYVTIALGLFGQFDLVVEIGYASAGARRIAELLDDPAAPLNRGIELLPAGPGEVELRRVTATGSNGELVLDRLSLEIPPGRLLAIVGRSGAGKTTLAHLLGRLREPEAGAVLLDGMPVASLATDSLRRAVAYAFERPALLGETVHDAISYARPGASRKQVEVAAEMAQADSFIRRLPAGYDTRLADAPLSGGEAQRLGLARAFAQDARLVVLDDATSSLDMVTEALVNEAVTDRLDGSTRVVIAHRASTAARADSVAWIDGGRLRGYAPHEELWADPGYRAVFSEGVG
jgi:ATP-binding cassette, subfamily B, bacterial